MTTSAPRPSGKYIPWYIVLFFAVQTALFAWFVYIAETTHTGLVTGSAYEKGLAYNDTIRRAEAQDGLGFSAEIRNTRDKIAFRLQDAQGKGLASARVRALFFRPAHDGVDFSLDLTDLGGGDYEARYAVPEKGLWEVRVQAETPAGPYQASKRMVIE